MVNTTDIFATVASIVGYTLATQIKWPKYSCEKATTGDAESKGVGGQKREK